MKILFDENVTRKLKKDLPDFEVWTVSEMGWKGKKNGVLLREILTEGFEALITGDKNIEHQQNFRDYPIPVVILNTRFLFYKDLKPLAPLVTVFLNNKPKAGINKIPNSTLLS